MSECQHQTTKVVNSRIIQKGLYRRRECQSCGERFSTLEIPFDIPKGRISNKLFMKTINKMIAEHADIIAALETVKLRVGPMDEADTGEKNDGK